VLGISLRERVGSVRGDGSLKILEELARRLDAEGVV
jgi:hypothetical protein